MVGRTFDSREECPRRSADMSPPAGRGHTQGHCRDYVAAANGLSNSRLGAGLDGASAMMLMRWRALPDHSSVRCSFAGGDLAVRLGCCQRLTRDAVPIGGRSAAPGRWGAEWSTVTSWRSNGGRVPAPRQ